MYLLPKVESTPMSIGGSSVTNSVMQCTKIILNMDRLISALLHQDFYSFNKYVLSSTCPLSMPLEHKYMKLTLNNNPVSSYNFHLHQRHVALQFLQWLQNSISLMAIVVVDKSPDFVQATPYIFPLSQSIVSK